MRGNPVHFASEDRFVAAASRNDSWGNDNWGDDNWGNDKEAYAGVPSVHENC
jgi:hypothetical protein